MKYPEQEVEEQPQVEEGELSAVLRANDPVVVGLGIMSMVMPAALAFQIASELKRGMLDRYELVPGIPTPETPEPEPYWKLREEEVE
jgi:hypothetical protein